MKCNDKIKKLLKKNRVCSDYAMPPRKKLMN